jgi:hypothetical protein
MTLYEISPLNAPSVSALAFALWKPLQLLQEAVASGGSLRKISLRSVLSLENSGINALQRFAGSLLKEGVIVRELVDFRQNVINRIPQKILKLNRRSERTEMSGGL